MGIDLNSENFWADFSQCKSKDFYQEVLEQYREILFSSLPKETCSDIIQNIISKSTTTNGQKVNKDLVQSLEELFYYDDNGSSVPLTDIYQTIISEMKFAGKTIRGPEGIMDFLENIATLEKNRAYLSREDATIKDQSFSILNAFKKLGADNAFRSCLEGKGCVKPVHLQEKKQKPEPKTVPVTSESKLASNKSHAGTKEQLKDRLELILSPSNQRSTTPLYEETKRKEEAHRRHINKPYTNEPQPAYKEEKASRGFDPQLIQWGTNEFQTADYKAYKSQIVFFDKKKNIAGMVHNHEGTYIKLPPEMFFEGFMPSENPYCITRKAKNLLEYNSRTFPYFKKEKPLEEYKKKKAEETLELETDNYSLGDLTRCYRRLAQKWHPNKNYGNESKAKEKFQEIQLAYDLLYKNKQQFG